MASVKELNIEIGFVNRACLRLLLHKLRFSHPYCRLKQH
jgi:hypothetical protein